MKTNTCLIAGVLMILFSAVGFSAASQLDVCDQDVDTLCGNIQPGRGVADCLAYKYDQISYPCRQRIEKLKGTLRSLKSACSNDVIDYCRDVRPGYGRVKQCLMNNLDKLSQQCQTQLNQLEK